MTADRTLTTRLKDDNWKLHQIAERAEGPASLIKGTMPKDGYVAMLGQQWFMHSALDKAFGPHTESNERIGSFVSREQFLTRFIEEDLTHFGICPIHQQVEPGTQRFIHEVEAKRGDEMFLLGLHYVRLGACNGNRFVAKVVRKAYSLPESGEGTRYLDPFGESQREDWWAFKARLDALELTQDEQDRVFAGTQAAYLHAICHGLDRTHTPDELFAQHESSLDKKVFDEGHSVHVGAGG